MIYHSLSYMILVLAHSSLTVMSIQNECCRCLGGKLITDDECNSLDSLAVCEGFCFTDITTWNRGIVINKGCSASCRNASEDRGYLQFNRSCCGSKLCNRMLNKDGQTKHPFWMFRGLSVLGVTLFITAGLILYYWLRKWEKQATLSSRQGCPGVIEEQQMEVPTKEYDTPALVMELPPYDVTDIYPLPSYKESTPALC